MALSLTEKQLDLLQYANDSRDFSMYIYKPTELLPPDGWAKNSLYVDEEGLYCEIFQKDSTVMFVIRGTEITDRADIAADLDMFQGKIPKQLDLLNEFYSNNEVQNLINGKRVIFTGNSMGQSLSEAMAAIYNKEAIGNNGYGVQPWIQKAALEFTGKTIDINPERYGDTIINYMTQTDFVGNAGLHLGKKIYIPGPEGFINFISSVDGQYTLADLVYHSYAGHRPNNFNEYDLNNPASNPAITDIAGRDAIIFQHIGEQARNIAIKMQTIDFKIVLPVVESAGEYTYKYILPVNKNVLFNEIIKSSVDSLMGKSQINTLIPEDKNFYIPSSGGQVVPSIDGSTSSAPNIVYQYTTKPNGGGLFGSLSTIVYLAVTAIGTIASVFFPPAGAATRGVSLSVSATIIGNNPLVLDLDGDGVETIAIDKNNVSFDINNDGFSEKTGWASGDDGMLAIDINNNGLIDNQGELFGSTTSKGFEDLRVYDTNNDNIINASDAQFVNLKVWQDVNENGITDEGELKTLSELGITSVDLGYHTVNKNDNFNHIAEESTFTKSDGSKGIIADVLYAYNKVYTQYLGEYNIIGDVADLPWIRGYGIVKDLQLEASNNSELLTLIQTLARENNAKTVYDSIDELLYKWTGSDSLIDGAVNGYADAKKATVVSKFLNVELNNITEEQKPYVEAAYDHIKNKIFVDFIAQTKIGNSFEINYDFVNDAIVYNDNTYGKLVSNLTNQDVFLASYVITKILGLAGSLDINKLAYTITEKGYGASLISYLNSGFQILDSGEMKILNPNTPMYVIGTSGNDTITGTDNADIIYGMDGDDILNGGAGDDYLSGGNGNDTLIGGDGNDTLDGGGGDDDLQGGYGDDTYIYDGQGKDSIIDERWVKIARQEWYLSGWWIFKKWKSRWVYQNQLVDAGNDVVIFGDDVKEKDITISKNGDDLIFELKNTDNKLTIKNWYTTKEQRVENFVFADGFVIKAEQIINSISDTIEADTLNGTDKDNFIVSSAGNDAVNAKKGDDSVVNYNGDTTYHFNLGDGNDMIMDYQGIDKIVFGADVNQEDVAYCRNDKDLIISIKNMTDSITILNWFLSDAYKIETLEFSNGNIVTSDSIHELISTTVATGYDDVIVGNDEDNTIDGLSGNDYIEGHGGNDTIIGGLGKDIMKGGAGDDIYYVDNTGDQIIENENEGNDTIKSNVSYALPDNVENLELIGLGAINGKGNNVDNTITGNDKDNILDGCGGTNTLKGGKGNDTYIINESNANDVIVENKDEGTDTVKSSINYTLNVDNVENLVLTGEANINGTGNAIDNYIEGNKGSNILTGGAGNDTLYGGGGSDTLAGGTGDDTYIIDTTDAAVVENTNEGTDTVITNINYALGTNVENLVLAGKEGITGTGNTANNVITGNDNNNTFVGGKGNDTLAGGAGTDTYVFNLGDGQDIIEENSPNSNAIDKIVFGTGITKNNIKFTKNGYDLIITVNGTSDKITIKNSNLAFGSRIERFEFADGSYINGDSLYTLNATSSKPILYSDVSYLDVSSKASAVDREYYEDGKLKSEVVYDDNGKISSEKYYNEQERLIQEKTYNNGLIAKEITYFYDAYAMRRIATQKEYIYSGGRISEIRNYSGTAISTTEKYVYGSNGLVNKITVYTKATTTVEKIIRFTYDSAKRLTTQTSYKSDGSTLLEKIINTYASDGRLVKKLVQIGYEQKTPGYGRDYVEWLIRDDQTITYTYTNGRLTKETVVVAYPETKTSFGKSYTVYQNAHTAKEVSYTYDSSGNLTRKLTRLGYDKLKQGSSSQYVWTMYDGEILEYAYSNGKLTKEVIYESYYSMVDRQYHTEKTHEIVYAYDSIGNIKSVTDNFWYDSMGGDKQHVREDAKDTYTYNGNYQLTEHIKYKSRLEYVTNSFGEITGQEFILRENLKTAYSYDSNCRLTCENIYKYREENNRWTAYLYEQKNYTYNSEGYLHTVNHYTNNKLVEAFKYEYTLDDSGYLIKQIIYKGKITNNQVASYEKYQEVNVNSYYNNLIGDGGNNTLNGSNQNDNLVGGAGNDALYGNAGNDILDGGAGTDLLVGGNGDDTYVIDNTKDVIVEHAKQGTDTVKTHLNYTIGTNLENLVLTGTGNVTGKGNGVDNAIQGNSGNNILYGYAGNDIIDGGAGNDTIYGGEHNDIISGGTGDDTLRGESGDDTYYFKTNDGKDNISDSLGKKDRVLFDADVDKNKIAIYQDGNNLVIDYGANSGNDVITITNQTNADNVIEKFELSDGTYITNYDVNQIIQNMTAYAQNNAIEFNGIESVKNNSDLMNLIASSWHN